MFRRVVDRTDLRTTAPLDPWNAETARRRKKKIFRCRVIMLDTILFHAVKVVVKAKVTEGGQGLGLVRHGDGEIMVATLVGARAPTIHNTPKVLVD